MCFRVLKQSGYPVQVVMLFRLVDIDYQLDLAVCQYPNKNNYHFRVLFFDTLTTLFQT